LSETENDRKARHEVAQVQPLYVCESGSSVRLLKALAEP
jgi:hypothetical protein